VSTKPRQQAATAVEDLRVATVNLIDAFQELADAAELVSHALENGEDLIDVLEKLALPQMRTREHDLDRFHQARYRVRLAIFGLAISEGMTVEDLARLWGVPQEMAERLAKQAVKTIHE
jgi:hypothetical protein